jgi:hypothetical protein
VHLSSHDDDFEYLELEASHLIMVDFNDRGVHSYMELVRYFIPIFRRAYELSPRFRPQNLLEPSEFHPSFMG